MSHFKVCFPVLWLVFTIKKKYNKAQYAVHVLDFSKS